MGAPASPLLGKKIGCYTVVERVYRPHEDPAHSRSSWRVVCTCGFTKVVFGQNLVRHFPLKCNHVPEGHRVIGPELATGLQALSAASKWELVLYLGNDTQGTWVQEMARAELARRGDEP